MKSCTSFCLDNNGYAVFGANYDHDRIHEGLVFVNKRGVAKSYWETDPVSEHARWTAQYGSVTFHLVMSQFAWGGMNEAGLVISTMELIGSQSPTPDKRPWIYSNYWVQYLLDNCTTIQEVMASDSSIRIKDYVDHYLVCDRRGDCATIEFLEGRMVCHTGQSLPVKVLANNTYEESVTAWNRSQGKPVSIRDPLLLRFVLAADRVQEFEPTDADSAVDYAFATLAAVSGQKVKGSPTHWSIVFDTQNLRIAFRTSIHPDIRTIDLHGLDFSPDTPVKMLDIHEKLSGDITREMKPYSFDLHFEHAFHANRKWGVGVDPDTLEKEIRYLESFPSVG